MSKFNIVSEDDTIKLIITEKNIVNLIRTNSDITREELAIKTKLSDRTVSIILKQLQEKDVIIREGSKKNGK